MGDEIVWHEYTTFNIVDVLSNIGGLYHVIVSFFGVLAWWINEYTISAKYIRSLYFIHKPHELKRKLFYKFQGEGYQSINDIMTIKTRFYNRFWKKANSEQHENIDQKELFL
jgi:hypothetical protein